MKHTSIIAAGCSLVLVVIATLIISSCRKLAIPKEIELPIPTETEETQTPIPSEETGIFTIEDQNNVELAPPESIPEIQYNLDLLTKNSTLYKVEFLDDNWVFGKLERVKNNGMLIPSLKNKVESHLEIYANAPLPIFYDDDNRWEKWKTSGMYDIIPFTVELYAGTFFINTTIADLPCIITMNNDGTAQFYFENYENFSCNFSLDITDYNEGIEQHITTPPALYDLSVLNDDKYIYSLYFYNDYNETFGSLEQNRGAIQRSFAHTPLHSAERSFGSTPFQTLAIYANSPFANLNNKLWSAWTGSIWISYKLSSSKDSATIQTTIADLACTIRLSSDGVAAFDFGTYGSFNYSYTLSYEEDTTNPFFDDLEAKILSGEYTFKYTTGPSFSRSNVYYDYVTATTYYGTRLNQTGTVTNITFEQYLTKTAMTVYYTRDDGFDLSDTYIIFDDGICGDDGAWEIYVG
jgi:hypothetical protein